MTVRELLETNNMIVDVEIKIRNEQGWMLDELNIGCSQGIKPKYPTRVPREPRWAGSYCRNDDHMFRDASYIPKSINAWDDGKDYYEIKLNRFPKGYLDLTVVSWDCFPANIHTAYSPRRMTGDFRNVNFTDAQRIRITATGTAPILAEPKEIKVKEEQMEGQITLEEMEEWM